MLALAVAFLATAMLTFPFIPLVHTAEIPLQGDDPSRDRSAADLTARLGERGLPASAIEVVTRGGDKRVMLVRGLSDAEVGEVRDALAETGRDGGDLVLTQGADFEGMLRGDSTRLPVMLTIQAVIFLLLGTVMIRTRVRGGRDRTAALRAALVGVAAGIAAVLLSAGIGWALQKLGLPVEEQAWLTDLFSDRDALLLIAPWIVLIGPVSEEIFFRGYVFRFITEQVSFPAGLIVSSLMFAAIHFNLSGLLVYLGIGVVMAWAYRRTQNLLTPVVGHIVTNGIVLVVAGLTATPGV
jgi:membrane protease YdiL (CAAX protease family)